MKCVTQRLSRHAIRFIAQHRMQFPRRSLYLNRELVRLARGRRQFFSESPNSLREVVRFHHRSAQPLHSVSPLGNRSRSPVNGFVEFLLGLTFREPLRYRLKTHQQPLKTLQESIV